jgi:4-hydroxy-4-methyl-2-oxoglutarate aldolase
MFHVIHDHPRIAPDLIHEFSKLDVATIHEAYDKRGAMAAAIKPLRDDMRVCGAALTVKLQPGDNLVLHRALDIVAPGEVLVVDIDGWEGGPWGDLMTTIAMARKAAGLVIDGFVRDVTAIQELDFPVFARGSSVKGTFKEALGLVNHPVSCGGVIVNAGDLIVGDEDGVCAVNREDAEQVLADALTRQQMEDGLRRRFASGESLWAVADLATVGRAQGLTEQPEPGDHR